jgi:hypothetical protein
MLSVIMLSVIKHSVVMLNVTYKSYMLNVVLLSVLPGTNNVVFLPGAPVTYKKTFSNNRHLAAYFGGGLVEAVHVVHPPFRRRLSRRRNFRPLRDARLDDVARAHRAAGFNVIKLFTVVIYEWTK